jgi:hypothetical protein
MKTNLWLLFALICFFCMLLSCVKDTDFDQADDIALTPVVELDLIFFTLKAADFFDSITQTPRLTVVDTTEIRFLDDAGIQENLKRAEFLFSFTNSISRSFEVDFQFLSEQNDTTYTTQTTVNEGSVTIPETTVFTENIEGEEILQLTQANKVVVSVTIPSADQTLEGALNLQSKTTYFLEIKD